MVSRLANIWLIALGVMAIAMTVALGCQSGENAEPATPAPAAPAPTVVVAASSPSGPTAPQRPADPLPAAQAAPASAPEAPQTLAAISPVTVDARKGPQTPGVQVNKPGDYKAAAQPLGTSWAYRNEYSPRPTTFYESPKNAALVKAGKIPPLAQRLPVPEDVYVFAPPDEIGIYGGVGRMTLGATNFADMENLAGRSDCMNRDGDGINMYPMACKGVEVSSDGRVYTIKLRRGLKWSDGTPLTMQDFEWVWSEELNYNKDLNPSTPAIIADAITGNPPKFKKIDDWTFSLSFDSPKYTFYDSGQLRTASQCRTLSLCFFEPFHFSKKFHPKYGDPAELKKLMDARGFTNWTQLWLNKYEIRWDANIPTVGTFYLCVGSRGGTKQELCSNPYFWGVDPSGNQLPYMDGWAWFEESSRDVAIFRAMNGEQDGPQGSGLLLAELPLYLGNMQKGDYTLGRWPETTGNDAGVQANAEYNEDAELGRWVRTKEFREALSLAMDRNLINEVIFLGIGTPQAWVPEATTPFSPGSDWQKHMAIRDIPAAKKRLADLGLVDTDGDGYVNRLDGKGNLEITPFETAAAFIPVAELLQSQWKDIGIRLIFKEGANSAFDNGTSPMRIRAMPAMTNPWNLALWIPYRDVGIMKEMGRYMITKGKEGMAPVGALAVNCPTCSKNPFLPQAPVGNYPADPDGFLKKLQDNYLAGQGYALLSPQRIEHGKQLFLLNLQNSYHLGSVGFSGQPQLIMKRNNVRNVPNRHAPQFRAGLGSMLYYFEDGIDNMNHPVNRSKKYKSVSFLECAHMASDRC